MRIDYRVEYTDGQVLERQSDDQPTSLRDIGEFLVWLAKSQERGGADYEVTRVELTVIQS